MNLHVTLKNAVILNNSVFKKAVEQYLAESSDTLKGAFDKAFKQDKKLKYDDSRLVVEALLQVDQDGANKSGLLEKILKVEPEYSPQRLTVSLQRLQKEERGMILRHDNSSGRYSFKDPFYRAFALAHTSKGRRDAEQQTLFVTSDFEDVLARFFRTYEKTQYRTEDQKRPLPKMDWSSAVFKHKRKFKKQKR